MARYDYRKLRVSKRRINYYGKYFYSMNGFHHFFGHQLKTVPAKETTWFGTRGLMFSTWEKKTGHTTFETPRILLKLM